MQKGFSTLELIITVFVIVLLTSCAVPNAARIVDRVSLDYEIKRLYTEMRFLQSHERMTYMRDSHFGKNENFKTRLIVYTNRYRVEKNADSTFYYGNDFSSGVTADKGKIIRFDDMGKVDPATSDTLTFTSRRGKKLYFVFDTVGRFRGSRKPPS